ncbi:hypothetical protein LJC39_03445 [Parabacteroides sp. OttesenSCG-928-B22]|nr:hypothetical protein [Parabacteroides sp. OttesenSCG-928-B22]
MFSKLLNLFKPKDVGTSDSSVILEAELQTRIVQALKSLRESKQPVQGLTLYIYQSENDIAFITLVNRPDFEDNLRLALENAAINEVNEAHWTFKHEAPPSTGVTTIGKGLFLHLMNRNEQSRITIRLSALKGGLMEQSYSIDNKTVRCNIGRGINPVLDNGMFHKNQIAIKDRDDCPNLEEEEWGINRFVSRKHAYITYNHVQGFALRVYEGGCYKTGNRTRLFRENNQPIDVSNTEIDYPLQHLDQIELGKSVVLLVEFIEN